MMTVDATERKKMVASKYCFQVISAIKPNGMKVKQIITQGKAIEDLLFKPK
jgi:hypothetical protein